MSPISCWRCNDPAEWWMTFNPESDSELASREQPLPVCNQCRRTIHDYVCVAIPISLGKSKALAAHWATLEAPSCSRCPEVSRWIVTTPPMDDGKRFIKVYCDGCRYDPSSGIGLAIPVVAAAVGSVLLDVYESGQICTHPAEIVELLHPRLDMKWLRKAESIFYRFDSF